MIAKLKSRQSGFTLVEFMLVVGIVAIMSAMLSQNFRRFSTKAKQTEARVILKHIFNLEEAYYSENGVYVQLLRPTDGSPFGRLPDGLSNCDFRFGGAEKLGFQISPCLSNGIPRYGYSVTSAAGFNISYEAFAIAPLVIIFPGCTMTGWPGDFFRMQSSSPVPAHLADVADACT